MMLVEERGERGISEEMVETLEKQVGVEEEGLLLSDILARL